MKQFTKKKAILAIVMVLLLFFTNASPSEAKGAVNAVVNTVAAVVDTVADVVGTAVATVVTTIATVVVDTLGLEGLANKDCSNTRTWSTSSTSYAINAVSASPGQITSDGISSSVISADASQITNTANCSQTTTWKVSGVECKYNAGEIIGIRIDEKTGPEQCATTSSSVSAPVNFSVTSNPSPIGSVLVSGANTSVYVNPASGNQTTLYSAFSSTDVTAAVTATLNDSTQSTDVFMPAAPKSEVSPVNLKTTLGDPCVSPLQATLSWDLSKSAPSQKAYQVQVDTQNNFPFPTLVDAVGGSGQSYAIPSGFLKFGAAYYWRVKILDSLNRESSWVTGPSFTTVSHTYPTVNFDWSPKSPSAGETVQFTDKSVTYGGTTISTWLWTLQDSICKVPAVGCNSVQNPKVTFQSEGSKNVSLKVTDGDGFNCALNKTIQAKPPLPGFQEVGPAR